MRLKPRHSCGSGKLDKEPQSAGAVTPAAFASVRPIAHMTADAVRLQPKLAPAHEPAVGVANGERATAALLRPIFGPFVEGARHGLCVRSVRPPSESPGRLVILPCDMRLDVGRAVRVEHHDAISQAGHDIKVMHSQSLAAEPPDVRARQVPAKK